MSKVARLFLDRIAEMKAMGQAKSHLKDGNNDSIDLVKQSNGDEVQSGSVREGVNGSTGSNSDAIAMKEEGEKEVTQTSTKGEEKESIELKEAKDEVQQKYIDLVIHPEEMRLLPEVEIVRYEEIQRLQAYLKGRCVHNGMAYEPPNSFQRWIFVRKMVEIGNRSPQFFSFKTTYSYFIFSPK